MMIMPNYCLWISLIRPRKLDTCAPQHIITKWPECIGEKSKMRNCSSQYTEVIYQICHGLCTVLVLISKAGGKSFTPNLEQLKTSKDYLMWSIENEIHNDQAWFESLNQTSCQSLTIACCNNCSK